MIMTISSRTAAASWARRDESVMIIAERGLALEVAAKLLASH
jgi:hypothetical protein